MVLRKLTAAVWVKTYSLYLAASQPSTVSEPQKMCLNFGPKRRLLSLVLDQNPMEPESIELSLKWKCVIVFGPSLRLEGVSLISVQQQRQ